LPALNSLIELLTNPISLHENTSDKTMLIIVADYVKEKKKVKGRTQLVDTPFIVVR
jgi:hypothetical protein